MRAIRLLLVATAALVGCTDGDNTGTETGLTSLDCDTPLDFYADIDGDGYGDQEASFTACEPPSGYTEDSSVASAWSDHPCACSSNIVRTTSDCG
jgi:hypothetical protein